LNGTLEDKPVLEVQVENEAERGLLGVAILNDDLRNNKKKGPSNNQSKPRVFLYFTGDNFFQVAFNRRLFPDQKRYS
jgi:hypothetical protein